MKKKISNFQIPDVGGKPVDPDETINFYPTSCPDCGWAWISGPRCLCDMSPEEQTSVIEQLDRAWDDAKIIEDS